MLGYSNDLFATKGAEYLLVIGFLAAFVLFWRLLAVTPAREIAARQTDRLRRALGRWFDCRPDRYYHPGHVWARPAPGGVVRVGIDDFAGKLLGRPDALELPAVGQRLEQGEPGWKLLFGGREIEMLCPVDGTVVARNEAVAGSPGQVADDPYERGWLVDVRVPRLGRDLRNLLSGDAARAWMSSAEDALRKQMSGDLGVVLQDGGFPVSGIARALDEDGWDEIARDFLRTGRTTEVSERTEAQSDES